MDHLSTDSIITYLDGNSPDAEKPGVEAHLASCGECSETMEQYQALELRLRMGPQCEPPADKMKAFLDQFPIPAQPERPSVAQLVASVVFDSFAQPMLAGVRGLAARPHQLLFRAGDIDVDLKIESTEKDELVSLAGQVIISPSAVLSNAGVGLESQGVVRYRTQTNEVGEFFFDVPKDTYNLSIDLPEGQLTILGVRPGSASN